MSEEMKNNNTPENKTENYSLNDDRRVKTLSPGALTAKRFFRNRLAVIGLVILAVMFAFSFIGGWFITPYGEDEVFHVDEYQLKEFVGAKVNDEFRYLVADGQELGAVVKAQFTLAQSKKNDSFTVKDVEYKVTEEGQDLYSISTGDTLLGVAYKDIVNMTDGSTPTFDFAFNALKAKTGDLTSFEADGKTYEMTEGAVLENGQEIAFVSRLVIQSRVSGTTISRSFRASVEEHIIGNEKEGTIRFVHTEDGQDTEYEAVYDPANLMWSVKKDTLTRVFNDYAYPSADHLLGTDRNGMDVLTRLMYGGQVSLVIGFIVVAISAILGVIMGGMSGYFGGWVDNLIMRIVDIFYCIPSTPLLIILGAAMDGMRVDPQIRMLYLMLILGFLGWPGIARMVRGQILSLREQEFMTATESSGLSVSRRIFKHLVPNVIPQLIVSCTMSLGSTIITEATLSFLGLGVKFPFASWGNIINDVNSSHVLTHYWFIWIPAGVCLMLAVLGFNFVGDGLRDAFDPKMKR